MAGLVYIAALAPDANETSARLELNQFPTTDVFVRIEIADGRIWLKPEGVACFASCPSRSRRIRVGDPRCTAADLFNQKVEGTAWRSKPSWYVLATKDRTVHPQLQRFVANRMGATAREVNSSHVPMLSYPVLVLDVIHNAANARR